MKKTRKARYEWYGAKSLYSHVVAGTKKKVYEERVVVLRAKNAEEAIDLAEEEARKYAASLKNVRYMNYVMVYVMTETVIRPGIEVFSLMRQMDLKPRTFMARYHDAKSECARSTPR